MNEYIIINFIIHLLIRENNQMAHRKFVTFENKWTHENINEILFEHSCVLSPLNHNSASE